MNVLTLHKGNHDVMKISISQFVQWFLIPVEPVEDTLAGQVAAHCCITTTWGHASVDLHVASKYKTVFKIVNHKANTQVIIDTVHETSGLQLLPASCHPITLTHHPSPIATPNTFIMTAVKVFLHSFGPLVKGCLLSWPLLLLLLLFPTLLPVCGWRCHSHSGWFRMHAAKQGTLEQL